MIECPYCKKKYNSTHEYIEDCFIDSDGWSWDYFHNCLRNNSSMRLNGYTNEPLKVEDF